MEYFMQIIHQIPGTSLGNRENKRSRRQTLLA